MLLSVVSINLIQNAGLIDKVKLSKEEHRASTIQEQKELFEKEIEISKYDGDTPKTINDLLNKLEEQKLITEEEKSTILQTGRITIGSKEIIFSEDAILPDGYTRSEYLESTGTQYIDLGDSLTNTNYTYKIDGQYLSYSTEAVSASFGCNIIEIFSSTTRKGKLCVYMGETTPSTYDCTSRFTVEVSRGKKKFIINGTEYSVSPTVVEATRSAYLFAYNNRGNSGSGVFYSSIKIYDFEVLDENDKVIAKFIPALDENDTPCMYDTVSGQTFYNQGTGEFIPGPISEVLPKLPKDYTRCAYLESTGTQCIDTEFVPKISAKLEMELKFDGDFQAIEGNTNVFGAVDTQSAFSLNFGEAASQKNQLFCWCEYRSKDGNRIRSLTITDDIRLNINKIVFQSEKIIYENLSANMATRNSNNDDSLAIFGCKRNGVYYPFKAYNMYLYSCKLYNGDELERNLIPCLDINDTPCMYDTVSGKTFYNQGTGEFIAGPVVE